MTRETEKPLFVPLKTEYYRAFAPERTEPTK